MTAISLTATPARSPVGLRERIPALDSLRGAAILAVFAYHAFFWSGMRTDWWLARGIALVTRPGWLGVDLFFVLSGFLITGRLLDHRYLSAPDFYRWFYTRRALRILPLYYITLIVVGSAMRWTGETSLSFLIVSALFMPNIALLAGLWASSPLAVLWSLGIEEQVYLVWPFLVRSLTARTLAWFFVALGLIEPLLRYVSFSTGMIREGIAVATWLRLDGFAWGGLLSILIRDARFHGRRLAAFGVAAIVVAVGGAVTCAWLGYLSRRTGVGSAAQLACADLLFAGLLAVALGGSSDAPMRPRRAGEVLRYFGRISYCLYLVHQFAFWSFDRIVTADQPRPFGPILVRAVVVLALSTAIAELSWRYLEAPSLALRPRCRESFAFPAIT
jgi:peptidoglycan/LPS O-acetylase OafA/YrhL